MKRVNIAYMGYSVRTDVWRYTVWLPFNGTANRGIWLPAAVHAAGAKGKATAVGDARMEELYSHHDDTGDDFDAFENENVATQPGMAAVCTQLYEQLRQRWA